ncbi:MAG: glycerol-3-phosphate dehydrogenase, partial [Atopococcus tabaci]|nr:glycerol-3-phosphate dehydrogenase [Atopococcus tabaci]
GQGMTPEEAVEKVGMVVEGFYTTKAVYEIAQEKIIDMPITNAIYQIITNQVEAKNASLDLMKREGKEEA